MLPDRVSNPGPLTYESGALPIALRGPATANNIYFRNKLNFSEVYRSVNYIVHWVACRVNEPRRDVT